MNDHNSAHNNNFSQTWMQSQQNNQSNQQQDGSYVDSYQPPTPPMPVAPVTPAANPDPFTPQPRMMNQEPVQSAPAAEPTPAPMQEQPQVRFSPNDVDNGVAPSNLSQTLEDQNIFNLLGVDGSTEEKEAFLDELQQVIWEDFLDRDVELLITDEEMNGLKAILAKPNVQAEQQQEEVLVYLDKLVPDLEAIMLEKALELKEDMVRERVAGMKEFHAGNQAALDTLGKAETLMNNGQWRDAADLLNSVK